jgi:hypothetical protein
MILYKANMNGDEHRSAIDTHEYDIFSNYGNIELNDNDNTTNTVVQDDDMYDTTQMYPINDNAIESGNESVINDAPPSDNTDDVTQSSSDIDAGVPLSQANDVIDAGVQPSQAYDSPDSEYNYDSIYDDSTNEYKVNDNNDMDISFDQPDEQSDSDNYNNNSGIDGTTTIQSEIQTDINDNHDAYITADDLNTTNDSDTTDAINAPVPKHKVKEPHSDRDAPIGIRRSTRKKNTNNINYNDRKNPYGDYVREDRQQLEYLAIFEDLSTKTTKQIMQRDDYEKWNNAMAKEINSLITQNVGTEVDPSKVPSGVKPLTCRFLYKIKYDDNNLPVQHKARLVVHGQKQTYGIDYYETFAPVAKSKSIKLLLLDAAINDKELKQFDVETAFLNAKLTETIYIELPDGCGKLSGKIWKLNKALYGLKQAPKEWYEEIKGTLINELGYIATQADPCVFIKRINNKQITLFLYVDDTCITYDKSIEPYWLADFKAITTKYRIKDLGNCEWILNMKVIRDRSKRSIVLSQQAYIHQLLIDHKSTNDTIKVCDNPADPSLSTAITHTELLNQHDHSIFRSIIGGLSYAANMTRIDIAYAVSALSRYLATPTKQHLTAAKRILRYLAGTVDYAMEFKPKDDDKIHSYPIVAYTDASHANDLTDRKSTTGTIIKLFGNTICWQSKKQKCVALHSTEAEYYALSQSVSEALWIRQWCKEVLQFTQPILVLCDNQSTIALSAHDAAHQRTKHIDVRYHFMRDHIKQGTIVVKWIPTAKEEADILTKCMVTKQFNELVVKNLLV